MFSRLPHSRALGGPLAARASFTLVELIVAMAILATLSMIFAVNILPLFHEVEENSAVDDLRAIEKAISMYLVEQGELPDSLDEIFAPAPVPTDPWGNPYQYTRIEGNGNKGKGKWRKDRFLVPINTDYDLFSMGPDGQSVPPLTASHSRDDIVRAANGGFVGPASEY